MAARKFMKDPAEVLVGESDRNLLAKYRMTRLAYSRARAGQKARCLKVMVAIRAELERRRLPPPTV